VGERLVRYRCPDADPNCHRDGDALANSHPDRDANARM
jgi:hypothetical protein